MSRRTAGILTLAIACSAPLGAAEIDKAEWQYLQFVDAVGRVGKQLQQSAGDGGWSNRELMAYARDLTRFNVERLRRWEPPVTDIVPAHRQLIHVLELAARHYEALARGNFGDAEVRAEDLKREYARFEADWKAVMERYPPPR